MRRNVVRIASALFVSALIAASCGGGDDDDDDASPEPTEASTDETTDDTEAPEEVSDDLQSLEVDRSSRFAQADTFCEPATEEPAEAPQATDEGITEDSISITHIRVTLEDLEAIGFAIPLGDTAHQAQTFVDIINERCGGIHGRMLDLSLVEPPPLTPEGQDPAAIAQAACIEATEDNQAVFAWSGSGWGGQGGAACVTDAHDTIYITTYTITPEEIANAGNRLYSTALPPADNLRYAAKVWAEEGVFEGKTVGVVFQDSPGDPEIVETGLLDTLEELGVEVTRADALGCAGGNNCNQGVIESVQGMMADGVDVIFPLLNVISLPGYIGEMVTQGFQPGQVQFYQVGYNAQSGDLVSSKVLTFAGEEAAALYNGTEIIAAGATGTFRQPGYTPPEFGEMCNREYQEAGGDVYTANDPVTNSAYGATAGACSFVRIIARAIDAAGPNPTREDLASAVENLGALDGGGEILGSFEPGKYSAPNALNRMTWIYPCPEDMIPFDGICIVPEGSAFPFPE
jgi:hypothetical protein